MAFEEVLLAFFRDYTPLLAFFGGLFVGDLMILLGILAGAGKANFFIILLFGFLGGLLHDIVFYFVAHTKLVDIIKKKFKLSKKRNKIAQLIEKMGRGNYFLPVLIAKFVYGVRDAVVLYVAHNNKKLKNYLYVVASAEIIWLVTITSVGWLAGKGFITIASISKGYEKWLFILLAALILIYFINKFIISFVLKHIRKHAKKIIKQALS